MKILVIGGTGVVGSLVVRALLAKKYEVRVLTRSIDNAAKLPAGAHAAFGSMEDTKALSKAFDGIDAVWMATPLTQNETQQGLAAVGTARAHGVQKFVYMSVHNLERAVRIPHFASKVPIQNAIRESKLNWTFIQPSNFFQNDLWFREAITQYGIYPQPIGDIGVSRVDVRDIADASVHALTEPGHDGKEYPLVGPDVLTGEKTAEIYSRHLGKDVAYVGNDLEAWEKASKGLHPDWLLKDLKIMYAHFQKQGLIASPHDLGIQAKVLGHSPRRFGDFVSEIAPSLRAMEKTA
jgi:uncharacterized protein YbjT (DUF2867 family)